MVGVLRLLREKIKYMRVKRKYRRRERREWWNLLIKISNLNIWVTSKMCCALFEATHRIYAEWSAYYKYKVFVRYKNWIEVQWWDFTKQWYAQWKQYVWQVRIKKRRQHLRRKVYELRNVEERVKMKAHRWGDSRKNSNEDIFVSNNAQELKLFGQDGKPNVKNRKMEGTGKETQNKEAKGQDEKLFMYLEADKVMKVTGRNGEWRKVVKEAKKYVNLRWKRKDGVNWVFIQLVFMSHKSWKEWLKLSFTLVFITLEYLVNEFSSTVIP